MQYLPLQKKRVEHLPESRVDESITLQAIPGKNELNNTMAYSRQETRTTKLREKKRMEDEKKKNEDEKKPLPKTGLPPQLTEEEQLMLYEIQQNQVVW